MSDHPTVRSGAGPSRAGFTLIELILVMGLLASVMAVAAPSLARYFRGRTLAGEAGRLLALTEYARSEAISQGLPAAIWLQPESRRFGVETRAPWEDPGRTRRSFTMHRDVAFQTDNLSGYGAEEQEVIVFAPDGFLETEDSLPWIGLEDADGHILYIQQTTNRWAYEISKELRDDSEG